MPLSSLRVPRIPLVPGRIKSGEAIAKSLKREDNANRMNGSEESQSYREACSESRAAEGSNDVAAETSEKRARNERETSEKRAEPSDRGTAKRK